ncbi:Regulator of RNase E activity RraA [Sinomicrobium oceani]|uniref:Regulator of RNase E activity RraA n=1 Tax=Sinomicrobium oceani TaxID=1150368 RepID=A0A1K1RAU4_9FLAO|nr:dimethylmenaquinone methyltransferase [Sinomicrobium oceani]SFW68931.1 Regulator of RNase E activity RraA [Sinomicrobium oceani]
MYIPKKILFVAGWFCFGLTLLSGQEIAKEELVYLTGSWKGERFDNGRPRIPDDLVERARNISIDEAWQILNNEGYNCQYEGDWQILNKDVTIAGRAVTAMYLPGRPDVEKRIKDRGKAAGRAGNTNSWPIEELTKGDVYVADAFGKTLEGTLIGDNLGNAIYAKTGNGVVFYGSSRDMEGLSAINGFNAYVKNWNPTYLKDVMLAGLNTPIRMGKAVVMPGDLVLAKPEGVVFIPAHLAEKVVLTAEFITLRDRFGQQMLREGKYSSGQIDSEWTDSIKKHFLEWLNRHEDELPMSRKELDAFMKQRTW